MPKPFATCLVCLLAATGAAQATPPRLTPLWTAPGFANPESVALGADQRGPRVPIGGGG